MAPDGLPSRPHTSADPISDHGDYRGLGPALSSRSAPVFFPLFAGDAIPGSVENDPRRSLVYFPNVHTKRFTRACLNRDWLGREGMIRGKRRR